MRGASCWRERLLVLLCLIAFLWLEHRDLPGHPRLTLVLVGVMGRRRGGAVGGWLGLLTGILWQVAGYHPGGWFLVYPLVGYLAGVFPAKWLGVLLGGSLLLDGGQGVWLMLRVHAQGKVVLCTTLKIGGMTVLCGLISNIIVRKSNWFFRSTHV